MNIPLRNLRNFLDSRGWVVDARPNLADRLIVFVNPNFPDRELALPAAESAIDFEQATQLLISKLASLEEQPYERLVKEAETATSDHTPSSSDNLILRVIKPSNDGEAIPLTLASTALNETQILLMASSCQAEKPQRFYRRIYNKTSASIVERAVFNHTRYGSFVLTVACPVLTPGEQIPLGLNSSNLPQTRKSFLALNDSVNQLYEAISENKLEPLVNDVIHSAVPAFSSNLVEAVASIAASDTGEGIEFSFDWSRLIQVPDSTTSGKTFSFSQRDAIELFNAATMLRPKEGLQIARFVGTVEALRGDLTSDQTRAGWVELSLLHPTYGVIRAAAELDPEQYRAADEAHISGAQFVAITGTIEPRARVWIFLKVDHFEYISAP